MKNLSKVKIDFFNMVKAFLILLLLLKVKDIIFKEVDRVIKAWFL